MGFTLTRLLKLHIIQSLIHAKGVKNLYLVGGGARDSLRHKEFTDTDLVITGIDGQELLTILSPFGDIDHSGAQFGVYKIIVDTKHGPATLEIALPRTETYNDKGGRYNVRITTNTTLSIYDDLIRRDFTMNAMAIDLATKEVIDPYNGAGDIDAKIIKTVGPPLQRITEDASRALRALRLSVQLGFSLDNELAKVISQRARDGMLIKALDTKICTYEFSKSWNISPGKTVFLWKKVGLTDLVKKLIADLPPFSPEPPILYEDEHYLVINKPAGILSHPLSHANEHSDPSIAHWLLQKDLSIIDIGEDVERPGIVHRLDKEVSGVMVIAKTSKAYESLKHAFQSRIVHKEYRAVVIGNVVKDEDSIDLALTRSKRTGKFIVATGSMTDDVDNALDADGKQAHTSIEVLTRLRGGYTFLKVLPSTGRTHQIRVHLQSYGTPIVGDPLYQTKKRHVKKHIEHLLLQAHTITFPTLDGEQKTVTAPLPAYFIDFIHHYGAGYKE